MKNAFHVADRVAYLHEGRIYFHGTPRELEQTNNVLIQDFLLGRSDGQLRVES
jgi:phospholipid/cholesterol/gamma-HCH transport system ATP-binding protein